MNNKQHKAGDRVFINGYQGKPFTVDGKTFSGTLFATRTAEYKTRVMRGTVLSHDGDNVELKLDSGEAAVFTADVVYAVAKDNAAMKARIKEAVEAAQDAFWAKVVELFPESVSGDFDPMFSHRWDTECEGAVSHWVYCNVPGMADEDKQYTYRLKLDVPHTVLNTDGYNVYDFFTCDFNELDSVYSREQWEEILSGAYKGRDEYGVGITWTLTEVK